jgi:Na+-translocating ferredoxin:NAD+ oxidoreductase subunit B
VVTDVSAAWIDDEVERINALLPQTQCRRCGYAGCAPYATAIVNDGAPIGLCPPGGRATFEALTEAIGDTRGATAPPDEVFNTAFIIETDCIGCARCIRACPVDAIIGAAGYMHTVVTQWCTGCELCVPVCPTDCIKMHPDPNPDPAASRARAARLRFEATSARRSHIADSTPDLLMDITCDSTDDLRDAVLAAVQRRAARAQVASENTHPIEQRDS